MISSDVNIILNCIKDHTYRWRSTILPISNALVSPAPSEKDEYGFFLLKSKTKIYYDLNFKDSRKLIFKYIENDKI